MTADTAVHPAGDPAGPAARQAGPPAAGELELLRALGAYTVVPPPASSHLGDALGLAPLTAADHTRLFVLDLPPYASVYLGADGQLGGDDADRVAGLWRALGLTPPSEPDHLASLLALDAELGHAATTCRTALARRRLAHARQTLRAEHLTSWLAAYLAAAATYPGGAGWAQLCHAAVGHGAVGHGADPAHQHPLAAALRDAPPSLATTDELDQLLDALVAPVRSGFVLPHRDLQQAGDEIGVGVRRGERRYTLRALLEQDPAATLAWLARHARRWSALHRSQPLDPAASRWWSGRATGAAAVLAELAQLSGLDGLATLATTAPR